MSCSWPRSRLFRLKRIDLAREILSEIEEHVEANSWQAAIVGFLQGRLTVEAFLAKASPKEVLTEAHAYIVIKANIDGDRATALRHLGWVKEQGLRSYTEFGLALGELDRIERKSPAKDRASASP